MLLQNESADADDDLEHFQDITENNDNQIVPASDSKGVPASDNKEVPASVNKVNKGHIAVTSNENDDDSDSSLDESGSASSDSEDFNEGDDLLGEAGLDKLEELKATSDHEVHNLEGVTLPGGYTPRHREPSYW